jgi:hypothetical protein
MPILKTDQLFGDLCGVSASAIYKARRAGKLNKTSEGYDTLDPSNHSYMVGLDNKTFAQRGGIIPADVPTHDPLDDQKKRADILLKKKMARQLDRKHDTEMKDLIPADLMAIYIGFFAEGIRNNFLNIGSRVARGDTALRDRIEKEIKTAIEKTIEGAARGLEKEGGKLIEALEEKD